MVCLRNRIKFTPVKKCKYTAHSQKLIKKLDNALEKSNSNERKVDPSILQLAKVSKMLPTFTCHFAYTAEYSFPA